MSNFMCMFLYSGFKIMFTVGFSTSYCWHHILVASDTVHLVDINPTSGQKFGRFLKTLGKKSEHVYKKIRHCLLTPLV